MLNFQFWLVSFGLFGRSKHNINQNRVWGWEWCGLSVLILTQRVQQFHQWLHKVNKWSGGGCDERCVWCEWQNNVIKQSESYANNFPAYWPSSFLLSIVYWSDKHTKVRPNNLYRVGISLSADAVGKFLCFAVFLSDISLTLEEVQNQKRKTCLHFDLVKGRKKLTWWWGDVDVLLRIRFFFNSLHP